MNPQLSESSHEAAHREAEASDADLETPTRRPQQHIDIVAHVRDAVIETDLRFRITGWNRGAEDMYGWREDEVLGRAMAEVTRTEFASTDRETAADELRHHGFWIGEVVQHHRDGHALQVNASVCLLRDHEGKDVGAVAINRDVTERRREQRLLESRMRRQEAVAQLGLYAVYHTAQEVIDRALAEIVRLLEVCCCQVLEHQVEDDRLALRASAGEGMAPVQWSADRTAHSVCDRDTRDAPGSRACVVIASAERPFGVLEAFLPAHRAFSPDEVNFLQSVANIIADTLTRTEMAAQLSHANRLNTVGLLAVGLAHDLGTPLNIISAYANIMRRSNLDEEAQRAALQCITEQVERSSNMVRQLLDFSRRNTPTTLVWDVVSAVRRTVDMMRPLAKQRRVAIDVEAPETSVPSPVEESILQQVLSNLIVNAIDAQPDGGYVAIRVTTKPEALPVHATDLQGNEICISVIDRGPGIPSHLRDKIFAPFFTTKKAGQGTGLGLAVSRTLIESACGRLELANTQTSGTTFHVYLPHVALL